MQDKVEFEGTITAVKARIRLIRSFNEVSHAYLGYTLLINGVVDKKEWDNLRIAVGKKAHDKHQFRIGDKISGEALPIKNHQQEWADFYKVSKLRIFSRGNPSEERPADIKGGIAPPLNIYREHGHLRLDPRTYEARCKQCPWGIVMATEIIIDHWKPDEKIWRYETHCYGPGDCPNYRPGRPRSVPARKGLVWVDEDFEGSGYAK